MPQAQLAMLALAVQLVRVVEPEPLLLALALALAVQLVLAVEPEPLLLVLALAFHQCHLPFLSSVQELLQV